jgi:hypothetical protein
MANDQSDSTDLPKSRSPWASLGYRDYRLLFSIALFATTAQQMRVTQNLFQVYELSGSAFQLGLTGLAQVPCLPWDGGIGRLCHYSCSLLPPATHRRRVGNLDFNRCHSRLAYPPAPP